MTGPLVAVALHDGYYSAGTGAGRSNRSLLHTFATRLAPHVELAILPVALAPDSPEYQPAWHTEILRLLAARPHTVLPLDNGTHGQARFAGLTTFQRLTEHTASVLDPLMRAHRTGLLVAVDQPFAGLAARLRPPPGWTMFYLPRSTADHHDDPDRAAWEHAGLTAWVTRRAAIGAISGHMRGLLAAKGVPASHLIDLPGGLSSLDDTPLAAAPPLPDAAHGGFLLSLGRAQPYKGFDDLLDALVLLRTRRISVPHLLLAAVSDGPPTAYQQQLAGRAARCGIDATVWTRFHPGIPGLLHHPALRGVVVPSRAEPLGRVPLESFAAGAAPVIATKAGGLAETVLDGQTGYSAPPRDPAALAETICRALRAPPAEIARLRANGLRLVQRRDYTTCITGALTALAPWSLAPATSSP